MNAATVKRTLSLIPDRVVRTKSGVLFDPKAPSQPERVVHLAQFLDWLGPLKPVTKDDLRVFGLLNNYGKPAIASSIEDEVDADADAELEVDEVLAPELLVQPAAPAVTAEPALT